MNCLKLLFAVGLVVSLVSVTGCSTARIHHSGRRGILDDPGVSRRNQSANRSQPTRAADRVADRESGETLKTGAKVSRAVLTETKDWRVPLRSVELTSTFGYRHGEPHEGVDLKAAVGTTVYSVAPGTVIYAGSKIRGYGRMVIIRHSPLLTTLYSHHSRLLVKQGQKVSKGQKIALSGKSGRVTGPHLHFEVRVAGEALDPLKVLPKLDTRVAQK